MEHPKLEARNRFSSQAFYFLERVYKNQKNGFHGEVAGEDDVTPRDEKMGSDGDHNHGTDKEPVDGEFLRPTKVRETFAASDARLRES